MLSHSLIFKDADDAPLILDSWMEKPAFGTALEEHLKRSNREIALPIEACVMMLLETGMKEEVRMQRWRKRGRDFGEVGQSWRVI